VSQATSVISKEAGEKWRHRSIGSEGEESFSSSIADSIPKRWRSTTLGSICKLNPPKPAASILSPDASISFVPMAAVDEKSGAIITPTKRAYGSVRGSYTAFQDGDVLFAKITPCMENGKAASPAP